MLPNCKLASPGRLCASNLQRAAFKAQRQRHVMNVRAQSSAASTSQSCHHEASQLRGPLKSQGSQAIFYTHVLCPYAQRAWLVLLEKGVPFELVNVDLSSKPGWYMQLNPAGLVPAVEWQGHVQTESLDICQWVDQTFEGPQLVPAGAEDDVKRLIREASELNSAGMSLLAGATGRSWGIGSGQSKGQKQQFETRLKQLSKAIDASGGPFLVGRDISLADIVYYPFLERFDIAMPAFCGYSLRDNRSMDNWLNEMTKRASVKTCSPDADLFLQALKKHMSLDFFDFHTYTATALHPHLK